MPRLRYLAIGTLLVGLITVGLVTYAVGPAEILSSLAAASLLFILCYIVTSLLIALVLTFKWKLILHAKGINVPYWHLFSYRLVGYSVSYLTPTAHVGGEPIRAYLLKREGVHINTAFSSVIIDKSIEIMADVVFFFLAALLILNSVMVAPSMKILTLSISLILIMLVGMFIGGVIGKGSMFVRIFRFLRLHKFPKLRPAQRNLAQIEKEVEHFYRTKKEYFIAIVGLIAVLWALMFLEYRFALLIFGHTASPLQIFLILTGVGLAYAVPIPAAMGTLELGQLSAAKVANLNSVTGVALAFLVRARDIVWTVIGLIFLAFYEFNFLKLSRQARQIDKEFEQGDLFRKRV